MTPDLVVRVSSRQLNRERARQIADQDWPEDSLSVRAGGLSYLLPRPLRRGRAKGELLVMAHDILSESADWNAPAWEFEPSQIYRFVATIERLFELLPEDFTFMAAWIGSKATDDVGISRREFLELVSSNDLGNHIRYRITGG